MVQVPSSLLVRAAESELSLRELMESVSPSTSEVVASSCSVVREKEESSGVEPRSTGPVETGASLTGVTVRSAEAVVLLAPESSLISATPLMSDCQGAHPSAFQRSY